MSDQGNGRQDTRTPVQVASGVRHGGTVIGIVLVVVGLVMLFGRYVEWFDLFRLWPLIIVIGGITQVFRPHGEPVVKRVAEGLGSVAVGLVLLGNTFGYIPWTVWVTMLSLWPLLLVALGIELLGKGLGLSWVRALSNVLLIVGLLYGVFVMQPGTLGVGLVVPGITVAGVPYQSSAPHDAAVREGNVVVKAGAARMTVRSGDMLARVSGRLPSGNAPRLTTTIASGVADVIVDQPPMHAIAFGVEDRTMDLVLDRAVAWKRLQFDVGAVQADLDLRDLKVSNVGINVGASDVVLSVGRASGDVNVDISGGAASVTVRVPADAAVTIESNSGLSNITVPSGYRRISGMPVLGESSWASAASGSPRVSVSVKSGVSNLTVETY